jgi:hypothetical protein
MTTKQAITDWLEVADKNLTNFTKSPFHEQLRTRDRDLYTKVFADKATTLKVLEGLFHKARKAKPFELTMSRIQAPLGCWELGKQSNPHGIRFVPSTGESDDEIAYRFVFMVVNARLLNPEDVIRHTCDNRKCLRPDHLIVGSAQENRQDDETRRYAGRGADGKGQVLITEIAEGVEVSIHPQRLDAGIE